MNEAIKKLRQKQENKASGVSGIRRIQVPVDVRVLVAEKADGHGEVYSGLHAATGKLPEQAIRMFCQLVPETGNELQGRFKKTRQRSIRPGEFTWVEFVISVLYERAVDIVAPPDCQEGSHEKAIRAEEASDLLRKAGLALLYQQHLGDETAKKRVSKIFCNGCRLKDCKQWTAWNTVKRAYLFKGPKPVQMFSIQELTAGKVPATPRERHPSPFDAARDASEETLTYESLPPPPKPRPPQRPPMLSLDTLRPDTK